MHQMRYAEKNLLRQRLEASSTTKSLLEILGHMAFFLYVFSFVMMEYNFNHYQPWKEWFYAASYSAFASMICLVLILPD